MYGVALWANVDQIGSRRCLLDGAGEKHTVHHFVVRKVRHSIQSESLLESVFRVGPLLVPQTMSANWINPSLISCLLEKHIT